MWLLAVALAYNDDSELIDRLRRQDPDAISQLYDRYGAMTYGVIYRIVADRGVAEELQQDVYLRVWERAQTFEQERGAIGPWLVTMARNRAIDYRRSVAGRMSARSTGLDALEPHVSTGRDLALDLDRVERLKAALATLTPQQRLVIELAYYEGLSQTEVAARLAQPLGTIKAQMRRALKVLKDSLQ